MIDKNIHDHTDYDNVLLYSYFFIFYQHLLPAYVIIHGNNVKYKLNQKSLFF